MLLARKASLDQIWTAATMHAKINRRKLDKLNITITRIWYNAVIFPENQSYIAMILEDAEEDSANIDLISQRKGQCTVLKTSTQQIVFQHVVVGLVYPENLTSGDSAGVNKDTYLILDNLPSEYDSRVKAVEVDETTEDYKDIRGLEKQLMQQIQELAEAVMLPMKHNERFQKLGVRRLKDILLYGPPETGKSLMALACSAQTNANFLKLAGSQLVQTVFLHVVDHVDPNKLTPGDLVAANKDTNLILDTLTCEHDSRVKDMEVDKEFTKSYSDKGGLEKQIQELVEEIILGLSGSPRKSSSSSSTYSNCDKDPFFKVPSPGKRLSKKQRTNDSGGDKEGDLEEEKGKNEIEGEESDAKSILIYEKIEDRLVQVGEITLVDTFGYFTFAKKMAGCYIGNPDDIGGKIPHALWPWPGYAIEYVNKARKKMNPIWKDWEEFQANLSFILARRNSCTEEEVPVTFKSVYDQIFDSSLQRRFLKGSLSFSYCVHFLWSSWLEEEPKSCQPPLKMVSTSKHSRWEIYYYDIERSLISFPVVGEMEVDNDDESDDEPDKGKGKEKLEDGGKGEAKVSSSCELVLDYELSYSDYDTSDVDDDDPFRHESFCDFFGRLKFIEIVFTPQASEPDL